MRIIAGRLRGRRLAPPRDGTIRPALEKTRGALFNMLDADLPGARVLDLFAGTGSLGLEALSRGAAQVTFVERARSALDCLEQNLESLGVRDVSRVVARDAFRLAPEDLDAGGYPIVIADPPFDAAGLPDLARLLETAVSRWLAPDGLLVVRWPSAVPPPPPRTGLVRLRERRYGDSLIVIDHLTR